MVRAILAHLPKPQEHVVSIYDCTSYVVSVFAQLGRRPISGDSRSIVAGVRAAAGRMTYFFPSDENPFCESVVRFGAYDARISPSRVLESFCS